MLTLGFATGIEGSAEAAVPLDDWNESMANGTVGEKVEGFESVTGAPEAGLSLFVKLALAAAICGACFAFIRAYNSRKGAASGRHGAYERVGV